MITKVSGIGRFAWPPGNGPPVFQASPTSLCPVSPPVCFLTEVRVGCSTEPADTDPVLPTSLPVLHYLPIPPRVPVTISAYPVMFCQSGISDSSRIISRESRNSQALLLQFECLIYRKSPNLRRIFLSQEGILREGKKTSRKL